MLTWQGPVPVQSPLQPEKIEPASAVAPRVTVVPSVKSAEQARPQEIPAGSLLTVPEPVPSLVTVSVLVIRVNRAVTLRAWSMVTRQGPVPVQSPPRPSKVECAPGEACRLTSVPFTNWAEQLLPQSIPAGSLVTVPEPVPNLVTSSRSARSNLAVTLRA